MRLFNVSKQELEDFDDDKAPPYAILSHTWGPDEEELTYQEVKSGGPYKGGQGFRKLAGCIRQTEADGLGWFWNDTFCIDKTNLVELSEAISSMFRWYKRAVVCYVYLFDIQSKNVRTEGSGSGFSQSRWFTRGWTLQELLAPKEVRFYNYHWEALGTRGSLCGLIERATGIPRQFLLGITPLRVASVAQRMSWAARRETRRAEDRAYCLLGLFDVSLPVIYGEGGEQAFWRLQDQMMRTTRDDSILAWGIAPHRQQELSHHVPGKVLASSPADFASSGSIAYMPRAGAPISNLELSGGSLRMQIRLQQFDSGLAIGWLNCGPEHEQDNSVAIPLVRADDGGPDEYVRPKGWFADLQPTPADGVTTTLVHIRNDGDSQVSTSKPGQQYVLYDENLAELGLEVVEVEPAASWDRDQALITSAVRLDGSNVAPTLVRLRQAEDGPYYRHDFVISLEFSGTAASGVDKAQHSLMICERDMPLSDVPWVRDMLPEKLLNVEEASNGNLGLRITLQPIPRHSLFVIRFAVLAGAAPETTINISTENRKITAALNFIGIVAKDNRRSRTRKKLQKEKNVAQTTMSTLESDRVRLRAEISKLQAELDRVETAIADKEKAIDTAQRELDSPALLTSADEIQKSWDVLGIQGQVYGSSTADGTAVMRWAMRNDYDKLAQLCLDELRLFGPVPYPPPRIVPLEVQNLPDDEEADFIGNVWVTRQKATGDVRVIREDTAKDQALPPDWEMDFNGKRWVYLHPSTGKIQDTFPCGGGLFPQPTVGPEFPALSFRGPPSTDSNSDTELPTYGGPDSESPTYGNPDSPAGGYYEFPTDSDPDSPAGRRYEFPTHSRPGSPAEGH